jgi:hypothetical protein
MTTYKTALLATAATFALGMGVAMAEDVPGATNHIVIAAEEARPGRAVVPNTESENKGARSAPEKNESQPMEGAGSTTGGMTDRSAGTVPGADAEGDPDTQNQGALSAPEKDTDKM